jgi:hypothetical protein
MFTVPSSCTYLSNSKHLLVLLNHPFSLFRMSLPSEQLLLELIECLLRLMRSARHGPPVVSIGRQIKSVAERLVLLMHMLKGSPVLAPKVIAFKAQACRSYSLIAHGSIMDLLSWLARCTTFFTTS